jgi:hypothetical protein
VTVTEVEERSELAGRRRPVVESAGDKREARLGKKRGLAKRQPDWSRRVVDLNEHGQRRKGTECEL